MGSDVRWRSARPASTWLVVDADDYVDVFLNGPTACNQKRRTQRDQYTYR